MNDSEIILELRNNKGKKSPVELALMLNQLHHDGLTQGAFIMYFKRAFPEIPLRTLLELGSWYKLSSGKTTDDEVNRVLSTWIKMPTINQVNAD